MEKPKTGISPKVLCLVIATLVITLIFFFTASEDETAGDLEIADAPLDPAHSESANPEPLFDDSEEEAENEFIEALSTDGPPTDFLETDYEPLAKWLNERFELEYKSMTPSLIFNQVPLNDIFYEVDDLSDRKEKFEVSSSDISRRELLEKIASFWDLEMTYVMDETNTPTAVRVSGR